MPGGPARRIGLFFKPPRPGQVKTRLVPPLTVEAAALLYEAFLEDAIATARGVPRAEIWLFNGGEPPGWRPPRGHDLPMRPQRGRDLGDRMSRALAELLERGPASAVIAGTDAPTLTPEHLEAAFEALESGRGDLVLGPSPDGGYCLIGTNRPPGDLLDGIAWSTDRVLTETESRAHRLGWQIVRVPGAYDIDTVADLEQLKKECRDFDRAGDNRIALATRRQLRGWPEGASQEGKRD